MGEALTKSCWMSKAFQPEALKIRVVLPVCGKDWQLMAANLRWQKLLDGIKPYECVIAIDNSIANVIPQLEEAAWQTFQNVKVMPYPVPPVQGWPQAPNWAFQHTARYMEDGKQAWFWMEPDCIPLCPNWLDELNREYRLCNKPIMGNVVEGMGHCNGTAIYPYRFPKLSKAAMTCINDAWDGAMKRETIHLTHNASHLMCHVWGIHNGRPMPFGGDPAVFRTWNDVKRWVDLNAVVFHRSKDESLIDQMRKKKDSMS